MRNLKRALSLALASVMLLGMMVIGTSAASFTDADEIVNTEAATITAGLGLFAGSEGKFNPAGTVTRAQMATVIVKMLYGSEINADSYKGAGKFSDVASFEGGWAEGYINLCANLGIVGGYGDGTFKPGQYLTTAEAVTMLLNALKVDAGAGTWPMTVMSAAEKIELYKDMLTAKPTTNEALTRDQLSVLVWNALNYSPDEKMGYKVGTKTYDDYMSAYLATGYTVEEDGKNVTLYRPALIEVAYKDTLRDTVFGVKEVTAIVDYNQATGDDYTVLSNGASYNIETGLDMIGREVTMYYESAYKSDKEPGVAYAVVEKTTSIAVAQVDGKIDSRSEYRSAFGSMKLTVADDVRVYQNHAIATKKVGEEIVALGKSDMTFTANSDTNTYNVPNGIYVIDEEANEIVAYHNPANTYITKVTRIDNTDGKETITLQNTMFGTLQNNEDEDVVVEYDGIAKGDYVAAVKQGAIWVLSKLDTVSGNVTNKAVNKDNGRTVLTIDGKNYTYFAGLKTEGATVAEPADAISLVKATDIETDFEAASYTKAYTFFLYNGMLVGYDPAGAAGSADVFDVIYVVKAYETTSTDNYGVETKYTYAQGVDMDGKEVNILVDMTKVSDDTATGKLTDGHEFDAEAGEVDHANWTTKATTEGEEQDLNGFYTFEKIDDREGAKEGIMVATAIAATYSSDDKNLFQGVAAEQDDSAKNKIEATSKIVYVDANSKTDASAYITSGSKLIKVKGTGNQMESALSESMKYTVGGDGETAAVLLSMDNAGNMILEALVVTSEESITTAEDVVYVAAGQETEISSNADGKIYEVYNAKTGEILTLTLDKDEVVENGFFEYTYDEAEKLYSFGAEALGTGAGAYEGLIFKGAYQGLITADNGLEDEDLVKIDNWDASKAIIVDVRGEKDTKEEGVVVAEGTDTLAAIADLETMVELIGEDEKRTIEIDVWASDDADDELVYVIYITSVSPRVDEE